MQDKLSAVLVFVLGLLVSGSFRFNLHEFPFDEFPSDELPFDELEDLSLS